MVGLHASIAPEILAGIHNYRGILLLLLLEKTDLSCRMPKLQGQVTKSIKQYNNRLKKGNAVCQGRQAMENY